MNPLTLGKIKLKKNVIYAPLAGCSDFPFRQMSARYKPGLMFCEMVKMEPLVRGVPGTLKMLDYSEEMRPIGGQICGSNPKLAREAARRIEERGFDVLDFNCGCPVDKVTKDGSGSGMLKTPELIGEILSEMVAAVSIPVTVKIRVGWNESTINAAEVTKIAEEAGATAITVHGRTRQQGYKGPANWDHIRACKDAARTIKVIANGDVFDAASAVAILQHTGCDGVLVARGTMGQPWIVEDIERAFRGEAPPERSVEALKQALLDHLHYSFGYKDERGALIDMRRVCCWYLKNVAGARAFRAQASHAGTLEEVVEMIGELV